MKYYHGSTACNNNNTNNKEKKILISRSFQDKIENKHVIFFLKKKNAIFSKSIPIPDDKELR